MIAVLVLVFLIIRSAYDHMSGVVDERDWYVSQLHYKFSARIDSLTSHKGGSGLIHFHLLDSVIDNSKERSINANLKYNGKLDFILFRPESRTDLFILHDADILSTGDSLVVNTDAEEGVTIFRRGKLIATEKTIESINGRPF